MTKNGGYVIIDLNDTTKIYKQALACLKSGKPVLVYDAPNIYYADTIAKVGDDVVITKGGKTITITDANSVSSSGDIQKHLYKYAVVITHSNTKTYVIYITTNKLLENVETFDDIKDFISEGDIVYQGDYRDSVNDFIGIYNDSDAQQFSGIYNNSGTLQFDDYDFANGDEISSVHLIKQLI